jgi:nitrite reductase/ring-hydroxylating ferredoxin subunit
MPDRRLICPSAELLEGGTGVRFALQPGAPDERGFVVRYDGAPRAYVNVCPHAGTELDWQPGQFFEEAGLYLVCSTHGALFDPGSGLCIAGPCKGECLEPIRVEEHDGNVIIPGTTP